MVLKKIKRKKTKYWIMICKGKRLWEREGTGVEKNTTAEKKASRKNINEDTRGNLLDQDQEKGGITGEEKEKPDIVQTQVVESECLYFTMIFKLQIEFCLKFNSN